MRRTTLPGVIALTALTVSACTDLPTTSPPPPAYSTDGFETGDQFVVVYNAQRLPNNHASVLAAHGASIEATYPDLGMAVVSGLTRATAASLSARSEVWFAAPDIMIPLELPMEMVVEGEAAVGVASPDAPGTAFFYPRQWNMRAIGADVAWAAGHLGSPDVTVAILDTGIGYTHPDVAGLVDLSRSASFVPSDDALVQAFFPGAHPVADLHWHGTHVGATVSSNAVAAAGVTSRTTLMGVKVCNVNGSCPFSSVIAGLMHAAENGAHVANMSLGGLFLKRTDPGFVSVINRAFTHVNRMGMTVVVAAGNSAFDLDHNRAPNGTHYPSLYATYCDTPTTLCVSATGPGTAAGTNGPWTNLDTHASYSNTGRSAIDVAAPGGRGGLPGNGGLVSAACSPFSLQVPVCQTGTFIIGATGTSMAAPHAAGVAALLVERYGANPGRIRSLMHSTADDAGATGTDPLFGKGRVSAARAAGVN